MGELASRGRQNTPQISGRFYADLYFVGDVWDASRADGEVADASSSL
jgi:hypothetical protein